MKKGGLYLCCTFIVLFFECTPEKSVEKALSRPNIILIMGDDMGYSDIGCYGGEIKTPTLDRLAANGLRFTQFYNAARCCPTRASLLTGLYPQQAGIGHMVYDRGTASYRGDLSKNAVTIAEVLKKDGYATYMSGKWHVTPYVVNDPPKENWPRQRGFDAFFGMIAGAGSFYDPRSLTEDNEYIAPREGFYATTDFTNYAVEKIEQHQDSSPFFMYLSYTAAHWPLHAPKNAIEQYEGHYDEGWDEIRKARFERMKQMKLLDNNWLLTPRDSAIAPWSSDVPDKKWELANMETYAAMVTLMDQGIGNVVEALEQKGQLENTVIIYLQDNGACAEELEWLQNDSENTTDIPLLPNALQTRTVPLTTRDGKAVKLMKAAMPGTPESYTAYGLNWANVSNTPFREYKHWVHEGGISSPLIVHWPKKIKDGGAYRHQPTHLIDIMATCLDISGSPYPDYFDGNDIIPLEGTSLVPAFDDKELIRDAIFWEHEGNRAVRMGEWKLVSKAAKRQPYIWDQIEEIDQSAWELFNIEADRTEMANLAHSHPELVKKMSAMWASWAKRTGTIPRPKR